MPKAKTVMFLLASKAQTPVYKTQETDSVFLPEKEKSKYLAESYKQKRNKKMQKRFLAAARIKDKKLKRVNRKHPRKMIICSILRKNMFLVRI